MKYGPIICDPNSEEAKKLIGKTVLAADFYTIIAENRGVDAVRLVEIHEEDCSPFKVLAKDGHKYSFNFIREIIEEPKKYRPYRDADEMVADFKKRFCSSTTIPRHAMPLIWVIGKETPNTFLVEAFITRAVKLGGNAFPFDSLFNKFTYLDGTPVGMEAKDD